MVLSILGRVLPPTHLKVTIAEFQFKPQQKITFVSYYSNVVKQFATKLLASIGLPLNNCDTWISLSYGDHNQQYTPFAKSDVCSYI